MLSVTLEPTKISLSSLPSHCFPSSKFATGLVRKRGVLLQDPGSLGKRGADKVCFAEAITPGQNSQGFYGKRG